jgi:hypothetical protein
LLFSPLIACKEAKKQEAVPEGSLNPIASPAEKGSALPYLFAGKDSMLMSWLTTEHSVSTLYFSELHEEKWSVPEAIASGTGWFVNWADYPQIAKNGDNYIAHFLKKSDTATYAYDVFVTQKQEGATWSVPFKIHRDTTKTEHGFVSYAAYGDSGFMVNWLDGRNTLGGNHGHDGGAMTLRAAIVSPDGSLKNESLLDERVCDCCQTATAKAANDAVTVYRDRSEKEVRDIYIVRYEDQEWTEPKPVHQDGWEIFGCPVNGPRVAALDEIVAVAWFTAAGGESKVNLAFSKNSGVDFDIPVRIDSGNPLGRVDVVLLDKQNAMVSWMEDVDGKTYIKLKKASISGESAEVTTLTGTSESRASGFPQMAVFNGKVYMAWTDLNEGITQVKTGSVN